MEDKNSSHSMLDSIEKVARALSLVAIPVILALLGYIFQQSLKEKDVSKDYVELAISILTKSAHSDIDPSIRSWAVDLLNHHSPTQLPNEATQKLKAGEVSLFDTLKVITSLASSSVAMANDIIAVGTDKGEISLWKASTAQMLEIFVAHDGEVVSISFSPDGNYLASGSVDETIGIWNIENLDAQDGEVRLYHKLTVNEGVSGVGFSPNGEYFYTVLQDPHRIVEWSFKHFNKVAVMHLPRGYYESKEGKLSKEKMSIELRK